MVSSSLEEIIYFPSFSIRSKKSFTQRVKNHFSLFVENQKRNNHSVLVLLTYPDAKYGGEPGGAKHKTTEQPAV